MFSDEGENHVNIRQVFVVLTPTGFKKHLLASDTSIGEIIKKYFIQIEKLYRLCLLTKVKKDDLRGIRELILQDLEDEGIDDYFTRTLVKL